MGLEIPPVEEVVIERKWLTVGELVEKLLDFDQSLIVFTSDNEYGLQYDVAPRFFTLGEFELSKWQLKETNLVPGDSIIVIE